MIPGMKIIYVVVCTWHGCHNQPTEYSVSCYQNECLLFIKNERGTWDRARFVQASLSPLEERK